MWCDVINSVDSESPFGDEAGIKWGLDVESNDHCLKIKITNYIVIYDTIKHFDHLHAVLLAINLKMEVM